MRLLFLALLALFALIQYPLWLGKGGWFSVWDLEQRVFTQRVVNDGLRARNLAMEAEVEDLRSGTEATEERARGELGLMDEKEVFIQILPNDGSAAPPPALSPKRQR
jgi:cell division protein FtsB